MLHKKRIRIVKKVREGPGKWQFVSLRRIGLQHYEPDLGPEQAVFAYFYKDVVEKCFQSLKGVVRLRPVRHWLYN